MLDSWPSMKGPLSGVMVYVGPEAVTKLCHTSHATGVQLWHNLGMHTIEYKTNQWVVYAHAPKNTRVNAIVVPDISAEQSGL